MPAGDVTFRWSDNGYCGDASDHEYAIQFYSSDLQNTIFTTQFTNAKQYKLPAGDLDKVLSRAGRVLWAVLYKNKTLPFTGIYHGPMSEFFVQPLSSEAPEEAVDESSLANFVGQNTFLEQECNTQLAEVREENRICVLAQVEDDRRVRVLQSNKPANFSELLEVFESDLGRESDVPLGALRANVGRSIAIGGVEELGKIYSARRF